MKICKKCGAKNSDDALFCDYCGNKLGEEFVFLRILWREKFI